MSFLIASYKGVFVSAFICFLSTSVAHAQHVSLGGGAGKVEGAPLHDVIFAPGKPVQMSVDVYCKDGGLFDDHPCGKIEVNVPVNSDGSFELPNIQKQFGHRRVRSVFFGGRKYSIMVGIRVGTSANYLENKFHSLFSGEFSKFKKVKDIYTKIKKITLVTMPSREFIYKTEGGHLNQVQTGFGTFSITAMDRSGRGSLPFKYGYLIGAERNGVARQLEDPFIYFVGILPSEMGGYFAFSLKQKAYCQSIGGVESEFTAIVGTIDPADERFKSEWESLTHPVINLSSCR